MIHRAIVMIYSVYEIRVTLSTKKIDAFGSGRLAAASTICGQARHRALRTDVSYHLPFHYPDMAGSAELKLMECWRLPAFDFVALMIGRRFLISAL